MKLRPEVFYKAWGICMKYDSTVVLDIRPESGRGFLGDSSLPDSMSPEDQEYMRGLGWRKSDEKGWFLKW